MRFNYLLNSLIILPPDIGCKELMCSRTAKRLTAVWLYSATMAPLFRGPKEMTETVPCGTFTTRGPGTAGDRFQSSPVLLLSHTPLQELSSINRSLECSPNEASREQKCRFSGPESSGGKLVQGGLQSFGIA